MAEVRFVRNPAFERELQREPQFIAGMEQRTAAAADAVAAASPKGGSGEFRKNVKARGTRVYVEPHFWHLIEFGSRNNHPYFPIRRGFRAAGMEVEFLSK